MMHEQAMLTRDHPKLGGIDGLVTIGDISQEYTTSVAANNAVKVKCANPFCGVKVSIVIPSKTKGLRKTTPSPHFRGVHAAGCDRKPSSLVSKNDVVSTSLSANPNRSDVPQVWIDPATTTFGTSGNSSTAINRDTGVGSGGQGRSSVGQGTSKSQSEMLERFAKAWLGMSQSVRKKELLKAPWNTEGTYASAFHPFEFANTKFLGKIGYKIYTAAVDTISDQNGDICITLKQKVAASVSKLVVIKASTFGVGAAGKALSKILANDLKPGVFVFALGAFKFNSATGTSELIVTHPYYFYLQV